MLFVSECGRRAEVTIDRREKAQRRAAANDRFTEHFTGTNQRSTCILRRRAKYDADTVTNKATIGIAVGYGPKIWFVRPCATGPTVFFVYLTLACKILKILQLFSDISVCLNYF